MRFTVSVVWSRGTVLLLGFFMLPLGGYGCGRGAANQGLDAAVANDASSGQADSDASAPRGPVTPETVCDGRSSLRIAHWGQPENADVGQALLLERGSTNFFLDGSCHAWLRTGEWGELRTLDLTAADVAALIKALRLAEWKALDSKYCVDVTDLGALGFYFDGKLITLSGCNVLPSAPFDIWQLVREETAALYARAKPITTGRVRYLLERHPGEDPNAMRGGSPWPLGNVEAASALDAQGMPGIRIAEDADAAALRLLRARYVQGEIGEYPLFGVPIVEQDGRRFLLFLRDESPFEQELSTIGAGER